MPASLLNRVQIVDADGPELRADARIIRGPGPELSSRGYGVLPRFALSGQGESWGEVDRWNLDASLWGIEHG